MHIVIQGANQDNTLRVVLVETATKFLTPLFVVTGPVGFLAVSIAIIDLLASSTPQELHARLPKCLAVGTATWLAKHDGSKLAEPNVILSNEINLFSSKFTIPVDIPVVDMKKSFGKVNGLFANRKFTVGKNKFLPRLPLVDDGINNTLLAHDGKLWTASPVLGVFVLEFGNEFVQGSPWLGCRRVRFVEFATTIRSNALDNKTKTWTECHVSMIDTWFHSIMSHVGHDATSEVLGLFPRHVESQKINVAIRNGIVASVNETEFLSRVVDQTFCEAQASFAARHDDPIVFL